MYIKYYKKVTRSGATTIVLCSIKLDFYLVALICNHSQWVVWWWYSCVRLPDPPWPLSSCFKPKNVINPGGWCVFFTDNTLGLCWVALGCGNNTYVMLTQLSDIVTRQKFMEVTYPSMSALISAGKGDARSRTSAVLYCEHLNTLY